MKLQSHTKAKKLWKLLSIIFYMIKRSLVSKRELIMDMNIMFKTAKLISRTVNYISVMKNNSRDFPMRRPRLGLGEYEFSCSNSPYHALYFPAESKRRRSLFSCIRTSFAAEDQMSERLEFSSQCKYEDEHGSDDAYECNEEINDKAEEFIKRFYEQLRAQSQIGLLC